MSAKTLFNTPITPFGLDECATCDTPVDAPLIDDSTGVWIARCDACAAKVAGRYVRLPADVQARVR